LLLQLPGATLVLALVVQVLAFSLSDVPMWRARFDEVAIAALKDPTRYRILLFGDSITQIATGRFSLGAPGEVGNLSTHAGVGLPGSLFLLQRYLSVHPSPEHVVLSFAPATYNLPGSVRVARYNLWLSYTQPNERDFLRTYFPGIERRDWLPAILDLQERLVEPFFSFLAQRSRSPRMDIGTLTANPDAPVEMAPRVETVEDEAIFKPLLDVTMSAGNAEALTRMCNLANKYGFRIEVAWPPSPAQLESKLTSSGALTELEAKISSIMEGHCDFAGFTDFNKIRTYPNLSFRNDLIHLFSYGWEQRYTADLREYLSGLRPPVPANATARGPRDQPEAAGASASRAKGAHGDDPVEP